MVIGFFGVQKTYVAVRDGSQFQISCADYTTQRRPDASWLRLTDCEYDLDHYAVKYDKDSSSKIERVYLPLRPVGIKTGPTVIVVERRDDDMLRVIEWAERGGGHDPPQPAFSRIQAQLDRPTDGVVLDGIDLDSHVKDELAKLDLELASDFVIIDNGAKPSLLAGIIMLVIGVLVAGGCTFLFLRELRIQRDAPPARPTMGRPPVQRPLFGNRPLFRFRRRK
jgi:hypothetical protein